MPDDAASDTAADVADDTAADLPAERARRLADLDDLRARGVDPYPVRFDRDRTLAELRADFGGLPAGTETETSGRVAGRILLLRRQGKLTFATVRDQSGQRPALRVPSGVLGEEEHDAVRRPRPRRLGRRRRHRDDHAQGRAVGQGRTASSCWPRRCGRCPTSGTASPTSTPASGSATSTSSSTTTRAACSRSGSPAVAAIRRCLDDARLRRGRDADARASSSAARRRGRSSRTTTRSTSTCTCASRSSCTSSGWSSAGSSASSRSAACSATRASTPRHNPEFTMLEAYQAFADYHDMMELTESLVVAAARASRRRRHRGRDRRRRASTSPTVAARHDGRPDPRARRRRHPSVDGRSTTRARCSTASGSPTRTSGARAGSPTRSTTSSSSRRSCGPTFVARPSARDVTAGARRTATIPTLVERFEVVVDGSELANAYSELNDPIDQRGALRSRGAAHAPRATLEAGDRRRGLPPGARVRPAAHRRHGPRHRPAHHAARRRHQHPRGHPVPDAQARGLTRTTQFDHHEAARE